MNVWRTLILIPCGSLYTTQRLSRNAKQKIKTFFLEKNPHSLKKNENVSSLLSSEMVCSLYENYDIEYATSVN